MNRATSLTSAAFASCLLAFSLTSCKKPPAEAPPSGPKASAPGTPAIPSAPAAKASVVSHASKLGFAARLPKDTEMYIGTVNLKSHLDAAAKSTWWKDIEALMNDKTPKPSGPDAAKDVDKAKKLFQQEVFLAMPKGGGASCGRLREIGEAYNEITYRALMTGGMLGGLGGAAPNPDVLMQSFMDDPALLERIAALLPRAEVPPLIAGFKADKAEELVKELFDEKAIAEMSKKGAPSELTTALGGKFRCFEFKMKDVLTEKEKAEMLGKVKSLPGRPDPKPVIEKIITELQKKVLHFAFGSVDGHVVFAVGKDLSHLAFTDKPDASLLAKPEFDFALPYMEKNLLALMSVDAIALQAMSTDQPFQPLLRGLLSGFKSGEMFKDIAAQLEPKIAELASLEKSVFTHKYTNAVAVAWWDKGLHFEGQGGAEMTALDLKKPLKFASLLDDPGVVLGSVYCGANDGSLAGRKYFEKWMELIHFTATQLVKAGLGGPQGAMMLGMADLQIIPHVTEFYKGSREIYENALGSEGAVVVDLGGRMPPLPGLPPDDKERKMLRLAGVNEVANRALIGESWKKMDASLRALLKAIPSPQPIPLPDPMTTEKNGITSYFLPLPMSAEDLNLYTSVNDRLYLFGTSKNLNESIAGKLAAPPAGAPKSGTHYVINMANVRELVKSFSGMAPNPDAKEGAKSAADWLAPFEKLQGSVTVEDGKLRNSLHWEIHDVMKFD